MELRDSRSQLEQASIVLDTLSARLRENRDPEVMANFAGSVCKMFFAEDSARILFTQILQVVGQAAMDGENLSPALSVFHTFGKCVPTALDKCSGLASIRHFTDLRATLYEVVVVPLSAVLGHKCRVRMWVLPAGTNRYRGLVSFNMGEAFRLDFEAALRLATKEAPYEELHDAECLLLKYERVKTALRTRGDQEAVLALEWYENKLCLGSLVPETYTWHFPRIECDPSTGSIVWPNAHNGTLWALSFDFGIQNGVCDQVILRMLDRFIRAVGPLLPMELETLTAEVSRVSSGDDNLGAYIEPKSVPGRRTLFEETPPLTAQLPEDIAGEAPITDSELWSQFNATFDCIPCPYPQIINEPELWVYSAGDPKGDMVSRWVRTTREIRGPDTALIVGPSGTGKTVLVTSLLGRGGRPHMVPWPVGDDPRQANIDAHGAEKNYYPNSGERVSILEAAQDGVVFADEFLSALARDKGFDLLKAPIEEMRAGRTICRLGSGGGKRWISKALIVFAGTPTHYGTIEKDNSEWIRRFGRRATVPGWLDLEPSSRAVILRWCILQEMAKNLYTRATVHVDAFHWLVLDPQPREYFEKTNMSGIRNIVSSAGTFSSIDDGVLRLSPEQISDHIRDAISSETPRRGTLGDRWLSLGEESAWENGLAEREQLVLRLARWAAKQPAPEDKVNKESLWLALRSIKSETDVYNTAYLFCAAVRCIPVEISGGEDTDPFRTACHRYQDYFNNKAPWLDAVKKYLPRNNAGDGAIPSHLKIRGPSKGDLGDKFEQHVLENARQIQGVVERLACAYPPFFHIVPYWNYRMV